jgi:hypothetical protein
MVGEPKFVGVENVNVPAEDVRTVQVALYPSGVTPEKVTVEPTVTIVLDGKNVAVAVYGPAPVTVIAVTEKVFVAGVVRPMMFRATI